MTTAEVRELLAAPKGEFFTMQLLIQYGEVLIKHTKCTVFRTYLRSIPVAFEE
jgi:hypothetical protein